MTHEQAAIERKVRALIAELDAPPPIRPKRLGLESLSTERGGPGARG